MGNAEERICRVSYSDCHCEAYYFDIEYTKEKFQLIELTGLKSQKFLGRKK